MPTRLSTTDSQQTAHANREKTMNPAKTALILVGYQNDYFAADGILRGVVEDPTGVDRVLDNTLAFIRALAPTSATIISTPIILASDYRAMASPVGILNTMKEVGAFKEGSTGAENIPELDEFGDRIVYVSGKVGFNAFSNTRLEDVLKRARHRERPRVRDGDLAVHRLDGSRRLRARLRRHDRVRLLVGPHGHRAPVLLRERLPAVRPRGDQPRAPRRAGQRIGLDGMSRPDRQHMDDEPVTDKRLLADLHVEATSRLMEALVESENRMRRRVELLADAVIETDADGTLVFLNPAWESLTGLAVEQCLGHAAREFFPDDLRADVDRVLADRTGEHQELTTRLERADGRDVHVVLTTSPIPTGGVVAVLRDVTREHEYQEELGKLSVVASSTSNLVVITDADGYIDWVNPAFEQRTGYSLDEVRGRTPGSFLQGPDTDPAAIDRLRTAIHERRPASEELLNYTKSGEPYWVNVNLTPVIDAAGRLERFISVQDDTTERKRVDRMKTQFVSTVSHELRTPLTSINGALGLLFSGVAGPLSDQAHEPRADRPEER